MSSPGSGTPASAGHLARPQGHQTPQKLFSPSSGSLNGRAPSPLRHPGLDGVNTPEGSPARPSQYFDGGAGHGTPSQPIVITDETKSGGGGPSPNAGYMMGSPLRQEGMGSDHPLHQHPNPMVGFGTSPRKGSGFGLNGSGAPNGNLSPSSGPWPVSIAHTSAASAAPSIHSGSNSRPGTAGGTVSPPMAPRLATSPSAGSPFAHHHHSPLTHGHAPHGMGQPSPLSLGGPPHLMSHAPHLPSPLHHPGLGAPNMQPSNSASSLHSLGHHHPGPGPADTRTQLFVGNLPFRVRWQDLKDLFRKCGTVLRADVALTLENRSKGFGTVLFANRDDAARAIETYNGFNWQTRILDVRLDSQDPSGAHALAIANAANAAAAAAASLGNAHSPHPHPHHPAGSPAGWPMVAPGFSPGLQPGMQQYPPHLPSPLALGGGVPMAWDRSASSRQEGSRPGTGAGLPNKAEGHGDRERDLSPTRGGQRESPPREEGQQLPAPGAGGLAPPQVGGPPASTTPLHEHGHVPQQGGPGGMQPMMVPVMYAYPGMPPGGLMSFYGGRPAPLPVQYANRHLFVGNLPFNCQWQDLKDLFRNAGNILRADVALGPDNRSRGFGTVLFATPEDAQNAMNIYNGYEYNGRILKVHFDKFAQPGSGTATPSTGGSMQGSPYGLQPLGHPPMGYSPMQLARSASSSSHPADYSMQRSASNGISPAPSPPPHSSGPYGGQPPAFDGHFRSMEVFGSSADPRSQQEPLPSPFLQDPSQSDPWASTSAPGSEASGAAEAKNNAPALGRTGSSRPPLSPIASRRPAPATRNSVGRPTSITMPPPFPMGGPLSPPTGRGLMTPSMPAFSFQPFPQTPPLMPQFFSPGLGSMGAYSPHVETPGWGPSVITPGSHPHAGMAQQLPPGYNPMFPPTSFADDGSIYNPTVGGQSLGAAARGLGVSTDDNDSRRGSGSTVVGPHEGVPVADVEGAANGFAALRVDADGSPHDTTSAASPTKREEGGGLGVPGSNLAARRASFFGAPGAEKATAKDQLAHEDSTRRASFDVGSLLPRRGGLAPTARTVSDGRANGGSAISSGEVTPSGES